MHTNISINNGKTKLHTRVCRHKFRNFLWIFWQHTWGCFYNCCHYYYHKKSVYVYSFDNWFYNLLPDIHVEPAMSVSCFSVLWSNFLLKLSTKGYQMRFFFIKTITRRHTSYKMPYLDQLLEKSQKNCKYSFGKIDFYNIWDCDLKVFILSWIALVWSSFKT
jgi:hypothetical protein